MLFVIDFDGTITSEDTVDRLLEEFADPEWQVLEEQWVAGRINSRECMRGQVGLIGADLPKIHDFIRTISIDPDFPAFVDAVSGRAELAIVSDGLDYTIGRVLDSHALSHLPVYANELQLTDSGMGLSFPYSSAECKQQSGVCKCSVMRALDSAGGRRTVLIGDGRSDFCIARNADIVFAKGSLRDFCERENIDHFPIDSFRDVIAVISGWDVTQLHNKCEPVYEL